MAGPGCGTRGGEGCEGTAWLSPELEKAEMFSSNPVGGSKAYRVQLQSNFSLVSDENRE